MWGYYKNKLINMKENQRWVEKLAMAVTHSEQGDYAINEEWVKSIVDKIVLEERFRIWSKLCDLSEPDERQTGAGDLNTHLDVVHKIINL